MSRRIFTRPLAGYAAIILLWQCAPGASAEEIPGQFSADFDHLWTHLRDHYAYFDKKETDWEKVRAIYRPKIESVTGKREFVTVLERVLDELYDPHTHLKVNTPASTRLIPSGLDVWAEWEGKTAVVTELRRGFSAEQAGLRPGMKIVSINGVPVEEAIDRRLGVALKKVDDNARSWALRALLAGTRDTKRLVEATNQTGARHVFELDQPAHITADTYQPQRRVEWKLLPENIGYIAVKDLGGTETVAEFDAALEELRETRGLVLDLRETPSGGNTSVAEPIMGRLLLQKGPYQKGVPVHGSAWTREASPRGDWTYQAPMVVLVGRWTASMGEGIAIGLDAMKRARIVGTRMAGLNGAVFDLDLPQTRIRLNYAAEKLFHLDGTPREEFVPPVQVRLQGDQSADPVLDRGLETLHSMLGAQPVAK